MTVEELADKIHKAHDRQFTHPQITAFVSTLFQDIVDSLLRRERVVLAGIGVFKVRVAKARIARNTLYNTPLPLPPTCRVKFLPCKTIRRF